MVAHLQQAGPGNQGRVLAAGPDGRAAAASGTGGSMSRIRVLIAEDEPGVRQALAELITGESSLELVAAAGHATQAVELAQAHRPDVALLDVKMPGGGGQRAAKGI